MRPGSMARRLRVRATTRLEETTASKQYRSGHSSHSPSSSSPSAGSKRREYPALGVSSSIG